MEVVLTGRSPPCPAPALLGPNIAEVFCGRGKLGCLTIAGELPKPTFGTLATKLTLGLPCG